MKIYSATLLGVRPLPVEIEIDLSEGLPFFQIVGLPDTVLKESKTRVKSAIIQGGFAFPYNNRVVLNLSPSKVKKEGSGFELGMAARILASAKLIPFPDAGVVFLGELALDGGVRSVSEITALVYVCHQMPQAQYLVVPQEALQKIPQGLPQKIICVNHLMDLARVGWWENTYSPFPILERVSRARDEELISELKFSPFWARHLEIASVGRHHYFLCGPPGCGKTFFAENLQLFNSENSKDDDFEIQILNAIFNRSPNDKPWAAPHHSASMIGLLGGGNPPKPGAVTRAHGGILFLDELLEFSPAVLDSLREPIEKGSVEVYRAGHHVVFPSRMQVVAATNPCRCGNWGHSLKNCFCNAHSRQLYQSRMSGPLLDRFDVKIFCRPPLVKDAVVPGPKIAERIKAALNYKKKMVSLKLSSGAEKYLDEQKEHGGFNHRALKKIRALSETMAFLALSPEIQPENIAEAIDLQTMKGLENPA